MSKYFRHRAEKGQDLVEYALVLPVLMLLLLGIVEFGLAIWHYDTLANAGREVARCGIIYANLVAPNSIEAASTTASPILGPDWAWRRRIFRLPSRGMTSASRSIMITSPSRA